MARPRRRETTRWDGRPEISVLVALGVAFALAAAAPLLPWLDASPDSSLPADPPPEASPSPPDSSPPPGFEDDSEEEDLG